MKTKCNLPGCKVLQSVLSLNTSHFQFFFYFVTSGKNMQLCAVVTLVAMAQLVSLCAQARGSLCHRMEAVGTHESRLWGKR